MSGILSGLMVTNQFDVDLRRTGRPGKLCQATYA